MKKLIPCLIAALPISLSADQIVNVSEAPPQRVTIESAEAVILDGGLWPNLLLLPDGNILLSVFNQPSHGQVAGDVDGWKSADGGKTWKLASALARRPDEDSNRMNHAKGFMGKEKHLISVVSGYQNTNAGESSWHLIPSVVVTSTDGGDSWSEIATFDYAPDGDRLAVPFGQIRETEDGVLRFAAYTFYTDGENTSYLMESRDQGKTWDMVSKIADGINETIIMEVAPKEWIAVARTVKREDEEKGQRMKQFRSKDDGKTWEDEGFLTGELGHPANLIRLENGSILMTYSDRLRGQVLAVTSEDGGKSWSDPLLIEGSWGASDGGYPATVQLPDGTMVTAFYSNRSALTNAQVQYHTGIVRWQLP